MTKIYSQMTEEEKQVFDLSIDYGFIKEAEEMIGGDHNEKTDRRHKTGSKGIVEMVRAAARKGETHDI